MFSDQFRRGETDKSKLAGVKSSRLISGLSDIAWKAFQSVNQRLPEGESIRPNWAPGPLLKSYERSAPPLRRERRTRRGAARTAPGTTETARDDFTRTAL